MAAVVFAKQWALNGPFPVDTSVFMKLDQGPVYPLSWTCTRDVVPRVLTVWALEGSPASETCTVVVLVRGQEIIRQELPAGHTHARLANLQVGLLPKGTEIHVQWRFPRSTVPVPFEKARVELRFEEVWVKGPGLSGWSDDPLSMERC